MRVTIKPGLWLLMAIVFVVTLGAAFSIWFFLRGQETRRAKSLLVTASNSLQDRVEGELDQELSALQRMAAKWQIRPDMNRIEWEFDVRQILEQHPSLLSIAWIENPSANKPDRTPRQVVADWRITWALPTVYEPAVIKLHGLVKENRIELLTEVAEQRRTRISDAIVVADRGKAFAAYIPSIVDGKLTGALVGVFHLQVMMDYVFDRLLASDYSLQLLDGYEPIYSRGLPKNRPDDWEQMGSLKIFGSEWKMRLWPSPDFQRANEKLADLILVCGAALACIFSGLIFLIAHRGKNQKATYIPDAAEHRRKIEERLRLWEATISSVEDAIFVAEAEKVIGAGPIVLFINEAFTRLTGFESSEIVGKSPKALFNPEFFASGEPIDTLISIWHKANVSIDVEIHAKPVLNSNHDITHWIISLKKAEAPKSAPNFLEKMLADSPLPVQILDAAGKVLQWNSLAESTTGFAASEIIGQASPIAPRFPKPGFWTREDIRILRKNGNRLDLAVYTAPLSNPDGTASTRYMSFMADLTGERLAHEQLSELETSFRALVENASDILAILDLDTTVQYINPAVHALLGLDPNRLIGRSASTILEEITPGSDPMILHLRQKDGPILAMEGTILPIKGTPLTLLAAHPTAQTQPTDLLNAIQDAILTYDTQHRVLWMNQAAEQLYGFTAEFAKGKTLSEVQPDWLQVPSRDHILQALDFEGSWKGEISNFSPSGREIVQDVSIAVTFNDKKEATGSVAIHRDITGKKSAIDAIAAEDKTKTLNALGSTEGLWDWNLRTDEVYFSPRWKEMLGYSDEEITGDLGEWYMLVHPDDLPILRNRIATYLKGQPEPLEAEYRARTRGGQFRWMITRAIAMRNESGEATRLVGLQTDIHDQKQLDEQLLFEAFHDSVTGLANRALFLDRLNGLLAHPAQPFAVAFLDLVNFAKVNETLGTRGGDKALAEAGRRIAESLPPNSFVARHGSDEFVALIPTADPMKLEALAALLRSRLAKSFEISGRLLSFSINIGYATTLTGTFKNGEAMLQQASRSMAASRPKPSTGTQLETFQPDQLRVFFHPIVDLQTGEIGGLEALIRWQHPELGLLTPDQFLPAAESSGLILKLDRWMLAEACSKAREINMRTRRIHPLTLTVNLSSAHFLNPADTRALEEIIRDSEIDPNWLRFELNEQTEHSASDILHHLSQLHARLNIKSDAGDRIKLSPTLVREITSGRNLDKIRDIIHSAQSRNLLVVAEGVESLEQLAVLRELKCHLAQGFYFTKPASANDTERLLARSPRW